MLDLGKDTRTVRAIRRTSGWICRTFFRIEHRGVENIPPRGPLIIAANHQTYFDPFFICLHVYCKTHYMTWHKTFRIPGLAQWIRWLGAFPVNIDRSDKQAIRRSLDILEAGDMLIIFPEGGRSRAGALDPFKLGMAQLALTAGVPIMPVTLHGGDQVWSPRQVLPRTGTIRVRYHPVLPVEPLAGTDKAEARARRTALTRQVREVIGGGLEEFERDRERLKL